MNNKRFWGEVASSSHFCNPSLTIKAGQLLCYTNTTDTKLGERRALTSYTSSSYVVGSAVYDKPAGIRTVSVYNGTVIPVRIQDGVNVADVTSFAATSGSLMVSAVGEAVASGGSGATLRGRLLTPLFSNVVNGTINMNGNRYVLCVAKD